MRWMVVTPQPTEKSAGIQVLHKLIALLNHAGERAFPHYSDYWQRADHQPDAVVLPDVTDMPDHLYPGATRVRYCLYYPGAHGMGPTEYHEPIQFTFLPKFLPGKPVFYLSTIDRETFAPINAGPRPVSSVYLGKGNREAFDKFVKDHPAIFRITRTEPADQANLALMLNLSRTLYSFDPVTRLIEEAAACGCVPMIPAENGEWKRAEVEAYDETPVSVMIDAVKTHRRTP